MPTSNYWLQENQVIITIPREGVALDELSEVNQITIQMLRAGFAATNQKVHLVVDASRVTSQPNPLQTRSVFTYMSESALGLTVVGGIGNPLLYFFTRFVSAVVKNTTTLHPTPELALAFLQRRHPHLTGLVETYQDKFSGNKFLTQIPQAKMD